MSGLLTRSDPRGSPNPLFPRPLILLEIILGGRISEPVFFVTVYCVATHIRNYPATHILMHVVAVLNQKGGSGKTTIATNLASDLKRRGASVVLIDADPQQTASEWASRGDDTPTTYQAQKAGILRDVSELSGSFDIVVIDGAPRMTDLARTAVEESDLVLIPVQPSGADLWAAEDILDIVDRVQGGDGGPQARFVVSRAVARTNLADSIQDALESYGVDVLDSRTGHRVAYPEALGAGLSVLETDGKAADEVRSLTDEVLQLLIDSNE